MTTKVPQRRIVGDDNTKPITSTEENDKISLDVKISGRPQEQINDALQNIAEVLHRIEFILKGIGE